MADTFDAAAYASALLSVASATGRFDSVIGHEAKNAYDGNGLFCELWGMSMTPARESSGLASLSVVTEFQLRIIRNMNAEPQDSIDVDVMGATSTLLNAIAGAFTLGGILRNVDLQGSDSEGLRAQLGYLTIGGGGEGRGRMFRVMDIYVPVIANDCWDLIA